MVIRVEQGKGRKERYVMLSPDLLELLGRRGPRASDLQNLEVVHQLAQRRYLRLQPPGFRLSEFAVVPIGCQGSLVVVGEHNAGKSMASLSRSIATESCCFAFSALRDMFRSLTAAVANSGGPCAVSANGQSGKVPTPVDLPPRPGRRYICR